MVHLYMRGASNHPLPSTESPGYYVVQEWRVREVLITVSWTWMDLTTYPGGAAHVPAEERGAELLHLWDVTLPVCCQQPNVTPSSTPPDVVQRQETTLTEAVEYRTEGRFCHSSSRPLPTTERQPAAARGRQVLDTLEHRQLHEVRKKCLGGTREPPCNRFTQSKWTIKSLDGAELECKNQIKLPDIRLVSWRSRFRK